MVCEAFMHLQGSVRMIYSTHGSDNWSFDQHCKKAAMPLGLSGSTHERLLRAILCLYRLQHMHPGRVSGSQQSCSVCILDWWNCCWPPPSVAQCGNCRSAVHLQTLLQQQRLSVWQYSLVQYQLHTLRGSPSPCVPTPTIAIVTTGTSGRHAPFICWQLPASADGDCWSQSSCLEDCWPMGTSLFNS